MCFVDFKTRRPVIQYITKRDGRLCCIWVVHRSWDLLVKLYKKQKAKFG